MKYRHLPQEYVMPIDWFDALQEFIGVGSFDFVISLASLTSIKVDAGKDDLQVSCAVMGRWRYNRATVTAPMPGTPPAGNYDVYVTASANLFGPNPNPPPDELDSTNYNFGLEIRVSGVPATDLYRKAGYVIWDGVKIVRIVQTIGAGILVPHGPIHDPGALDPIDWPAVFLYGTLILRPAAAEWNRGLYYFVTDDAQGGALYQSTGAAWERRLPGLLHAPQHLPGGSDPINFTLINLAGTLASRPAATAANAGFTYLATDDRGGTVYRSNGASWVQMAASVLHANQHKPNQADPIDYTVVHMRGSLASRPEAAPVNAGLFYLATDIAGGTLFQSTGAAWMQVAAATSVHIEGVGFPTYMGLNAPLPVDRWPPKIPGGGHPPEGMEVYLQIKENTIWHLRYRHVSFEEPEPRGGLKPPPYPDVHHFATGGWEVVGRPTPLTAHVLGGKPFEPFATEIVSVNLPILGRYRFEYAVIARIPGYPPLPAHGFFGDNQQGFPWYTEALIGYEGGSIPSPPLRREDQVLLSRGFSVQVNAFVTVGVHDPGQAPGFFGLGTLYGLSMGRNDIQPIFSWIRAYPLGLEPGVYHPPG
jgi:hypothetical protein